MKYSGIDRFALELCGTEDAVELVVSDAGVGFDVEEAKKTGDLGDTVCRNGYIWCTGACPSSRSPAWERNYRLGAGIARAQDMRRRGRWKPDGRHRYSIRYTDAGGASH